MSIKTERDALLTETDDGKWDGTLHAFWRRLVSSLHIKDYPAEILEKDLYKFRAHFATALIASPIQDLAQQNTNLPINIQPDELESLHRFDECVSDGEGYDVEKSMMERLAVIGVIRHVSADIYELTEFGSWVLKGRLNALSIPVVTGYKITEKDGKAFTIDRAPDEYELRECTIGTITTSSQLNNR